MSDPKSTTAAPDTTRPWGDRSVASGVEAVFLWAQKEIATLEGRANTALEAAHKRISDLERKMRQPAPPAAPAAKAGTISGAAAGADTSKGATS